MENGYKATGSGGPGPIRDFTDLEMWRIARQLRAKVYNGCRRFPKDETYGLVTQIRRAAVSVTANIAEGLGGTRIKKIFSFVALAVPLLMNCATISPPPSTQGIFPRKSLPN